MDASEKREVATQLLTSLEELTEGTESGEISMEDKKNIASSMNYMAEQLKEKIFTDNGDEESTELTEKETKQKMEKMLKKVVGLTEEDEAVYGSYDATESLQES
jgi:hypothetical protein